MPAKNESRKLVYPTSIEEILDLVNTAVAARVKLCAIGGQTGFAQTEKDDEKRWWISLAHMPSQIQLMRDDLTMVVPAQIKLSKLERYLTEQGFFLPIDVSIPERVTLGGMAASNARCLRTARYGGLRNFVLGMDIINSLGETMQLGGLTIKNVVGYDLAQLMIGSWGELGIITHMILKLLPLPEKRTTLLATFSSDQNALKALQAITEKQLILSRLEWISHMTSQRLRSPFETKSTLFLEVDGDPLSVAEKVGACQHLLEKSGGTVVQADDVSEQALIWENRLRIYTHIIQRHPTNLLVSIQIPPNDPDSIEQLVRVVAKTDDAYLFGHGLDGVWHLVFAVNSANQTRDLNTINQTTRSLEPYGRFLNKIAYGVDYNPISQHAQISQTEQTLRQRIKQAFDPYDLFRRA